jgi:hypothetical protein
MDLKIEHLIQNGKVNIWLHLQESNFVSCLPETLPVPKYNIC